MPIIKWLAGALVGLLFLLALAVLLVPMFVDPNDYRGEISAVVKGQTGRDLRLDGDLSISVFPWLGIRTQGLSLSQPAAIGGDMVTVENAQLRLKLMPLLSKQLEIDTVVLDSPTLNLITLQDGTSSFTGLSGDETAAVTSSAASSTTPPTSSDPGPVVAAAANADAAPAVALVVQGVEITNANLLWDDRQAGQKYQANDFNLSTGNLLGTDLAPIELSGSVLDASNPVPIALTVSGNGKVDKDTLVLDLEDLVTDIKQGDQNLQLSFAGMRFAQNERATVQDIEFSANAIIPAGEEAGSEAQPLALSGQLAELVFQFAGSPGQLELSDLKINTELEQRQFTLLAPTTRANLDQQTASLPQLNVNSGDLALLITDLAVTQFIDAPSASGRLELKPFNARDLISDLGIDYQPTGADALKQIGLSVAFAGSMNSARLDTLNVRLDESTLKGNVAVQDFTNLAAEFDLSLDTLNLDNYLPLASEDQEEAAVEGAEALAVPLAALRSINANGTFKADSLISGGLKLDDIDVTVVSNEGLLTVTPNAKLYEGTLGGKFAFQDRGEQASLKIQNEIDLVSLGNLLTDADVTEQLSGIGSLNLDLTVTEKNGVQSNEGVIKLQAKNGAIKGVDIKNMIDTAYNTYQQFTGPEDEGQEAAEEDSSSSDETRFAEMLGTFYLKDYKLTNDDFSLQAPLFRVLGEGEIDIASQTLNYLVKVAVVGSTDGQGGKAVEELKGITIPIRLRGDLSAPSFSLDMRSLYQSYAKRELDKKKGEFLEEKLGIEGGEELSTKDILKGALLNRLTRDKDQQDEPSEPVPYEETEAAPLSADQDESAQSEPVPYEQTETPAEPKRELTKKERREERKRKLLESIFK